MRGLEESREALLHTGNSVKARTAGMWASFANFALNDNVLEVAIGLIIASAFNKVVNSFVSDILLPPFSLLPFLGKNLSAKFAVLKQGPNSEHGYNTLKQAQDDGAIVLAYGYVECCITAENLYSQIQKQTGLLRNSDRPSILLRIYSTFIDKVINFFFVAVALFAAGRTYGWLANDTVIKPTIKCKYCRKRISQRAKRCVNCTSWQDGREDHQE